VAQEGAFRETLYGASLFVLSTVVSFCLFVFPLYIRGEKQTNKNKHKYVLCRLASQVGVNGQSAPT